jgi:hypothetical protein
MAAPLLSVEALVLQQNFFTFFAPFCPFCSHDYKTPLAASDAQAFALETNGIPAMANGAVSVLPGFSAIGIAMDRWTCDCAANRA